MITTQFVLMSQVNSKIVSAFGVGQFEVCTHDCTKYSVTSIKIEPAIWLLF